VGSGKGETVKPSWVYRIPSRARDGWNKKPKEELASGTPSGVQPTTAATETDEQAPDDSLRTIEKQPPTPALSTVIFSRKLQNTQP